MNWIQSLIDFVLHLDKHLNQIVADYGIWSYAILWLIVFCETGLVVTPFLPGDSLLFAVGALAAKPESVLNVHLVFLLLLVAAILGDTVNYHIGKYLGPKAMAGSRFIKREHLERTHAFFEKYGGKTIVLARFVPIVRTFAPFVAGVGAMTYSRFIYYNITGGLLWVGLLLYAGFFFGSHPLVEKNFGLVVIAIIVLSILPAVWELVRARRESKSKAN